MTDFTLKYDGTAEQLVGEDPNGDKISIPLESLDVGGSTSIDGSKLNTPTLEADNVRSDAGILEQRLEGVYEANRIRANAGVPDGETVGIRSGKSPGLTDKSALSSTSAITLGSESDVSSEADAGSGTEADPYIIRDRDITASSQPAILMDDDSQNYHLVIENCELTGDSANAWRVLEGNDNPELTTLRNCRLWSLNDEYAVAHGNMGVTYDQCRFSGSTGDMIRTADATAKLLFRDCRFDTSKVTGDRALQSLGGADTIDIRFCHFADGGTTLRWWRDPDKVRIYNTRFNGDMAISGQVPSGRMNNHIYKYCIFEGFNDTHVFGGGWQHPDTPQTYDRDKLALEIAFCDFRDNQADSRQVFLKIERTAISAQDTRVHHCKFTKKTGTNSAGNECLETFPAGKRVEFDHNWAAECPEDAFEHAYPIEQTHIHHCVGDNITGQIIDYFGTHDEDTASNSQGGHIDSEVSHIYGDGATGVILTDVSGVRVNGYIMTNTTGSCVKIEQRNDGAGDSPNDVKVVGPLALSERVGGDIVGIDGDIGTNNYAIYFDGEQIQTFDPDNLIGSARTEIR